MNTKWIRIADYLRKKSRSGIGDPRLSNFHVFRLSSIPYSTGIFDVFDEAGFIKKHRFKVVEILLVFCLFSKAFLLEIFVNLSIAA